MKKILVAVDGSDTSKKAILKARELVKCTNGEVILLNVVEDIMKNPYIPEIKHKVSINQAFMEQGENIIKKSKELLSDYNGIVTGLTRCGDPAKNIIDVAEKENCDLVIMGSRGLNVLSRAMLGSVSNKVLNHIHISVLIVK